MLLKLVVTLSCLAIAYCRTEEELKTWFFNHAMECNTDFPVTTEELEMMQKHQLPDTPNTRCLMACVFRKTSWLDDKGMFDVDKASALMETEHSEASKIENAKKLFDLCKKVNEETVSDGEKGCDRSFSLAKCLTTNAPEFGFPI